MEVEKNLIASYWLEKEKGSQEPRNGAVASRKLSRPPGLMASRPPGLVASRQAGLK